MGLVGIRENGQTRVTFKCDECGRPIEDGRWAMVTYRMGDDDGEVPVRVVHKGGCAGAREVDEGFIEADVAALYILHNVSRDVTATTRRAELLASL